MRDTSRSVTPTSKLSLRLTSLKVSNFGPIQNASLDLSSDVTIIMGPGNAGKTWLASLAYSLVRQSSGWLTTGYVSAIADILRQRGIFGKVSAEVAQELARREPKELAERFSDNAFVRSVPNGLSGALGLAQISDIVRHGQSDCEIEAEFSVGGTAAVSYTITVGSTAPPEVRLVPHTDAFESVIRQMRPQITVLESGGWSAQYAGLATTPARYVPSERLLLIPVFSSYLSLILNLARSTGQPWGIQGSTLGALQQLRQTNLDFLTDLGQVFNQRSTKPDPLPILDFGRVEVRPPKLLFTDKRGAVVDIAVASSGVAQLTGVIGIGEAQPAADTLFIEEPELNLHADAQLRVTDYLAGLSSRSNLVITTHSQYVATMLAIARGKGRVGSLRGYYLDPRTDGAEELHIEPESGSIALPKTIERALEEIGEAASGLSDIE